MEKQKVYIASGFKSNWVNRYPELLNSFLLVNPIIKEYKEQNRITLSVCEYGKWDLHFIKQSDIVFVYVERTNPSCIGLSCEAGFAKGLGKTVISVIEPNNEFIDDKYISFIGQVSDIVFSDINKGVQYLKSFNL